MQTNIKGWRVQFKNIQIIIIKNNCINEKGNSNLKNTYYDNDISKRKCVVGGFFYL